MAKAIAKEYQIKPTLIKGSGGVFEVTADDQLIFSKRATGRFPDEQEILELLREDTET